jgi:hypothetical protein
MPQANQQRGGGEDEFAAIQRQIQQATGKSAEKSVRMTTATIQRKNPASAGKSAESGGEG